MLDSHYREACIHVHQKYDLQCTVPSSVYNLTWFKSALNTTDQLHSEIMRRFLDKVKN